VTPNSFVPNDPNRPPATQSAESPLKGSSARASSPNRPPAAHPLTVSAVYRFTDQPDQTETPANDASDQPEASSASREEVLKAMRALREMPPSAREREIDFGQYSHFSPKVQETLRNLDKELPIR